MVDSFQLTREVQLGLTHQMSQITQISQMEERENRSVSMAPAGAEL